MSDDKVESKQSKGGKARAKALGAEGRKAIARQAALARWDVDVPRASHEGSFAIGDSEIRAAVLPNGMRLLTQSTFLLALGRARTPKAGTGALATVDDTPFFLQADVLKPFVSENLLKSTTPIFFIDKSGRRAVGYDAQLLPGVAEVYLRFRDSYLSRGKEVPSRYAHIVKACDILTRGLAATGIVALVDEATGFQESRAKDELANFLQAFIAKELRQWVRTFPTSFFRQLCRLKGIPFPTDMRLPRYFGHIVNDIVYNRLAPGVRDELEARNPAGENGRRRTKNFQWLSENMGHPKLLHHLGLLEGLASGFDDGDWESFYAKVNARFPNYKALPLFRNADGA